MAGEIAQRLRPEFEAAVKASDVPAVRAAGALFWPGWCQAASRDCCLELLGRCFIVALCCAALRRARVLVKQSREQTAGCPIPPAARPLRPPPPQGTPYAFNPEECGKRALKNKALVRDSPLGAVGLHQWCLCGLR